MSKFNNKTASRKTTNLAGGDAFKVDAKQELTSAVLNTFLEDKYYETGSKRAERIAFLVRQVKPEFVAKLAIIARNEFHLRSVSTLLIGELAKTHRGDSLVKDTIVSATPRVDDLTELLAYVGTPLPKQVKRGVRNSLLKFNRYQLAKYKGEGKAVSLVDLFNLVHPKVEHADDEQKQAWKDLIEGKLVSFDTWETDISNTKEKKLAWEKLVLENKLGYMALIRNLNNLIKAGVSERTIDTAVRKLTDEEEVRKSKQLPFRFVMAYKNVIGNRKLTDAISIAMDYALANVPKLPGRTLIGVDTSGSMNGDPIEKASIFAAALAKSNDSEVLLYANTAKHLPISGRTPIIDIALHIEKNAIGGGTNTGSVFQWAEGQTGEFDRIIILSDNESWNGSAQTAYKSLVKNKSNPYVYAIDIAGYGTHDLSGSKVKHLVGWSDRLLDFIGINEKGDIVDYVENYQLKSSSEEDE
jgi:60 kDa SS-A/Ro ribonucleoprotein